MLFPWLFDVDECEPEPLPVSEEASEFPLKPVDEVDAFGKRLDELEVVVEEVVDAAEDAFIWSAEEPFEDEEGVEVDQLDRPLPTAAIDSTRELKSG